MQPAQCKNASSDPSVWCAVPIVSEDTGNRQEPTAPADGGETGQACPADDDAPPAGRASGSGGVTNSAAGLAGADTGVLSNGQDADPALAPAEPEDAAGPAHNGPASAVLAAWETVGNMLFDDRSAADGDDGDMHADTVISKPGGAAAKGQLPTILSSTEQMDGADEATEQPLPQRARLPGEQALEKLGATLLYEKDLSDSDLKGSVTIPTVPFLLSG